MKIGKKFNIMLHKMSQHYVQEKRKKRKILQNAGGKMFRQSFHLNDHVYINS